MSPDPEDTRKLDDLLTDPAGTEVSTPLPAPRPAAPEAYLVRIHPPGPMFGLRYLLGRNPVVIGRLTACGIHDPDLAVSRMHARIESADDGRFRVTDLGSRNGTFVNHVRVESAALGDGDYLQVGGALYRFLAGGNLEAGYHEELHRLAVTDPLTGLPNRRALLEYLSHEVLRARRHNRPLCVLLFDVDRFKAINDTLGHATGDATLRTLATVLRPLVRRDEMLARLGGDEFAAALPEATVEDARRCGERLRAAAERHPFEYGGQRYSATISVGVGAAAAGEQVTPDELLGRADRNLYGAKRAGRNRVCG